MKTLIAVLSLISLNAFADAGDPVRCQIQSNPCIHTGFQRDVCLVPKFNFDLFQQTVEIVYSKLSLGKTTPGTKSLSLVKVKPTSIAAEDGDDTGLSLKVDGAAATYKGTLTFEEDITFELLCFRENLIDI